MRKETDLEAVKKVARSFVYLDVHINEKVGFICNHPYIGQIATVVNENGTLKLKDVRNEKDLDDIPQEAKVILCKFKTQTVPLRKSTRKIVLGGYRLETQQETIAEFGYGEFLARLQELMKDK